MLRRKLLGFYSRPDRPTILSLIAFTMGLCFEASFKRSDRTHIIITITHINSSLFRFDDDVPHDVGWRGKRDSEGHESNSYVFGEFLVNRMNQITARSLISVVNFLDFEKCCQHDHHADDY
jgi:hypothetical protein